MILGRMLWAKHLSQSVIVPHRESIVRRMLTMNQTLHGVAVVVQDESVRQISADQSGQTGGHSHDGLVIELEHICERHRRQLQATLACNENSTLQLARLNSGLKGSHGGARSVSNASENGLVIHQATFGHAGRRRTEGYDSH